MNQFSCFVFCLGHFHCYVNVKNVKLVFQTVRYNYSEKVVDKTKSLDPQTSEYIFVMNDRKSEK